MSRRESRPEASRECVLRPQREQCSSCGKQMRVSYHNRRTVCTLSGLCRLTVVIRCCQNPACERYHVAYHPEEEGFGPCPRPNSAWKLSRWWEPCATVNIARSPKFISSYVCGEFRSASAM